MTASYRWPQRMDSSPYRAHRTKITVILSTEKFWHLANHLLGCGLLVFPRVNIYVSCDFSWNANGTLEWNLSKWLQSLLGILKCIFKKMYPYVYDICVYRCMVISFHLFMDFRRPNLSCQACTSNTLFTELPCWPCKENFKRRNKNRVGCSPLHSNYL